MCHRGDKVVNVWISAPLPPSPPPLCTVKQFTLASIQRTNGELPSITLKNRARRPKGRHGS